ncbi:MAG TPA: methyltransferase type 11 [Candidatus Latescibacteria bacterium]|nr:methyltransferase type 11 [Candidatus Latescibacterota bacterium]
MHKLLLRPCPLCTGTGGRGLHTQNFAVMVELGMESQVDIVACEACGMVFNDIPTSQVELDRTYEEHSKYADTTLYGGGDEVEFPPEAVWDVERLESTAAWLDSVLVSSEFRVLDAGCATGTFLGALKGLGWKSLVGLDPSPVATETTTRIHGVETVTGSFLDPPADIGEFDVVALSHVLEHLVDVRGAVEGIRKLTRLGGFAYLEVPDASAYADHLVAPFHDFNTEHINHFSLPLLCRLMEAFGFTEVESGAKVIQCSATHSYPAIFGLWQRRSENPTPEVSMESDDELLVAIGRYVELSSELLNRFDATLAAELEGQDDVVIWGAGQLALKILSETVLAEKNVVAVIDGSPQKQGMHLGGRVVGAPEKLRDSDYPVVVASVHHAEAIVQAITGAHGLANRLVLLG